MIVWAIVIGVATTASVLWIQMSFWQLLGRILVVVLALLAIRRVRGRMIIPDALIAPAWYIPGLWGIAGAVGFTGVVCLAFGVQANVSRLERLITFAILLFCYGDRDSAF